MNFAKFLTISIFVSCFLSLVAGCLLFVSSVSASQLIHISDTISTSWPSTGADHTIKFTTRILIPPEGRIIITPDTGIYIPPDLDYTDLDFSVDGTEENLGPSKTATLSGVEVISGYSGKIIIILSESLNIPADSEIAVKIGENAIHQTPGDKQIINSSVSGSYDIGLQTLDSSSNLLDKAEAVIVILPPIQVGMKIEVVAPPHPPPSPPPSGGGGGIVYVPPFTSVIFSGRAYPGSVVTLLKDAQIAVKSVAGPDSNFEISFVGLSGGNYIFSLYGEDKNGLKSPLFTFSVSITSGATTKVSGIFLAPTIAVDKSEVKKGENIAIFGQSASQAEITIAVNSEEEIFVKTKTDKNGVYLYNFDTSPLGIGQHLTKSKAAILGEISPFSKAISFLVGTKTVTATPEKCQLRADLNNDCRVNLVDFSIAAYWYKRPSPPASCDFNGDGKIDLIDFSIMAFYWTG